MNTDAISCVDCVSWFSRRVHATHSLFNAKTQRRKGTKRRMRSFIVRRGPGRRSAARDRWVGRSTHPSSMEEGEDGTDAPTARRPVGSPTVTDARIRNRRASHRLAAIFRSPAVPPSISGTAVSPQLQPLCTFAPLRLCASALSPLCSSVSLRLCGFLRAPPWCLGVLVVLPSPAAEESAYEVLRAPLRVRLLVPRGSLAARGPSGPRRRARAARGGAGGSQYPLRRPAILEGRPRSRNQATSWSRACLG